MRARRTGRRGGREHAAGVTKRLGVDFESVKARNPRIVYGSISGFGQYGPTPRGPRSTRSRRHERHHVGDRPSRPGSGPRRRRRHRHHGRRVSGARHFDRAARPRRFRPRPLGADLADRSRHHAAGFPGDALDHGQKVPPQEGNYHPTNVPMGLYPTATVFSTSPPPATRTFKHSAS